MSHPAGNPHGSTPFPPGAPPSSRPPCTAAADPNLKPVTLGGAAPWKRELEATRTRKQELLLAVLASAETARAEAEAEASRPQVREAATRPPAVAGDPV